MISSASLLIFLYLVAILIAAVSSFVNPLSTTQSQLSKSISSSSCNINHNILKLSSSVTKEEEDSDGGQGMLDNDSIEPTLGNNWMKRSSSIDFMPADIQNNNNGDDATYYMDIGINGHTFGTGDLSKRMHGALMKVASTKFGGNIPSDLIEVYLLYAMDTSAKEAVKAAMDSNGYAMNIDSEDLQDEGAWGQITNVQLHEDDASYNSFLDAVVKGGWEPGDTFSFIVREVPTRKKAMDLEALLRSLDPDGTLWEEAKEKGLLMPGDEITTLKELSMDCEQRVKTSPQEAMDETDAFRGGLSKGYNVINRNSLLQSNRNDDGTENQKTLLHVMDSLANHGCLIVDLTDGDTSTNDASVMAGMWNGANTFFDKVLNDDEDASKIIPPMQIAEGVGSSHAMVGFASFKDGDNQFLETRLRRSDGTLLPEETSDVIGEDGTKSMVDAFHIMSNVGKDIVRIATAASSVEANAFVNAGGSSVVSEDDEAPSIAGLSFEEASASGIVEEDSATVSKDDIKRADIMASEAAILLTDEIMDDGKPLLTGEIEHDEGDVSMSPHRICRYANNNPTKNQGASEIFGAHTDTSFVTIVPAAQVSGLEVFDEDALQWYRPELNARKHAKKLDPNESKETQYPWHARYLIVMPGELLQLTSRNNIQAAVHRVVAVTDKPRLSAPVLLRARPGTKMNVERYMGSLDKADGLLLDSNGMKMEDIHDALQPPPKQ